MTSYDKQTQIWSGPERPLPYGGASLGSVILQKLSENPDKLCQIHDDSGTKLTNGEMKTLSVRATINLTNLGLQQGDVVGFVCKNNKDLVPVVIGCFLGGFPFNPMDPNLDVGEICHFFVKNQPKVVFCDNDCLTKTQEALNKLKMDSKVFTMIEKVDGYDYVDEILKDTFIKSIYVPPTINNRDHLDFALLASSGTTGLPKGVKLSHSQGLYFGWSSEFWKVREDNLVLCFTNLFWVGGLMHLVYALMNSQTYIMTIKSYAAELAVEFIEKYKVTNIFSPVMYSMRLLQSEVIKTADLSSIREYLTSSNPMPKESMAELAKYFPNGTLRYVYGMTELFYLVAGNSGVADWGSVGDVVPNTRVKIADDEGNLVGPNEKGELLVKLPCSLLGYYKNPEANENAFDDDGWLKTGDVGYFSDSGHLYLVDRKKDIIRYHYFHIFPTEIEQVIQKLDGVKEVCVVGVPEAAVWETLVAIVVKIPGSKLKEEDVYNIVANELTDYKKLRGGVFFVDEDLPKTGSSKVQRRLVKANAEKLYAERN